MSRFNALFKALKEQPPLDSPYPSDHPEKDFKRWQYRIMVGMMGGYALFYFVRKNLSMALKGMEEDLGYSNTELGVILTVASLVYGIGKFLNGMIADRANPRWFMAIGLFGSALVNFCFGISEVLWVFVGLWALNSWFQSMGWPPCAKLLTSWYEPKRLATWWGVWNASHQIGGGIILILGGYLAQHYGWRYVLWVPAGIALLGCIWIIATLRDRPESMGFESPHKDEPIEEIQKESVGYQVRTYILSNPLIWLVSFGNLFVYIVRIGLLDWAPKFLKDARGIDLTDAGFVVSALEIAGILGGLFAGYLADQVFKRKYSMINGIYMIGLAGSLAFLYYFPINSVLANALILSVVGFLVYGPQMLTAVSAAYYAPRSCAAAATGFNGLFGYIGASISGIGTGYCVDHYGWDGGIIFYLSAAFLGIFVFAIAHVLHQKQAQNSPEIDQD